MSKVIIIVGLPGSGKTTYAKAHVEESYVLFDDAARSDTGVAALKKHLETGGNAVVTDVYALTDDSRERTEAKLKSFGATSVLWIFFENDPIQCIRNIKRRNEEDSFYRLISDAYVHRMSEQYTIPENSFVIPVWKN